MLDQESFSKFDVNHQVMPIQNSKDSAISFFAVNNLACSRDDEHLLFKQIDFELFPGEILQIVGANGSGKSSLLMILAGLLTPLAGEVSYQGQPIKTIQAYYLSQLGFLGHKLGIKAELTVLENIHFSPKLSVAIDNEKIMQVLQQFQLHRLSHTLCQQLSAGQKQRLALAELVLSAARLWILDEPFTAIDASGFFDIEAAIQNHCAGGGAVILVSHQPLVKLADQVKVLNLTPV